MAVFTSTALALRKKMILTALKACGAFSPETALTLEEAGVENPSGFPGFTEDLVGFDILGKTKDGRYWIQEEKEEEWSSW